MEWDKKISTIFQETELNLAKVKERLDAGRNSTGHLSQSVHEFRSNLATTELDTTRFANSLQVHAGLFKPLVAPAWVGQSTVSPAAGDDITGLSLDQSPGLVALLSDKVDAQNRVIEMLAQTVRNLEEERRTYSEQVIQVRDEMAQLNNRIVERGVDLQTERKVEQWKHEMMSQMTLMQSQFKLQHETNRTAAFHEDNQVTAVLREVQDLRRFMREECGDVRNSVDNLKSRLVLLEVGMNQTNSENKGLSHRQDALDRSFHDILTTQCSTSRDINTALGQTQYHAKSEVSELRSSLRAIRDKLETVETKLTRDPPPSSGKRKSKSRRETRQKPAALNHAAFDNDSPQYSDLELDLTPDFSDLDSPNDGRKAGLGDYDDFNLYDLSSDDATQDNLDDIQTKDLDDIPTKDFDDIETAELDDVNTAATLNLTVDDLQSGDDLELSDNDLSIDQLN